MTPASSPRQLGPAAGQRRAPAGCQKTLVPQQANARAIGPIAVLAANRMANHSGAISHAWNHSDCCCGSPHDCAPHPRAARHISRARGLLGASPAGFWASRSAASALWSRSLAPRGTGVASSGASDPFGGACGFVCNSVSFHRLQAVFGGLESPRGGLQDVQKAQNLHKGAQTIHFHTEVVRCCHH